MRNQLVENKEFNILSRSIDNATKCTIIKVAEDYFSVKLEQLGKFEIDETVELFTMTDKGQLYFETIVKEVKKDVVSMWFPITYKYLQRREYSRIPLDKEVSLKIEDNLINAKIIDISAGGLKVETNEQLKLLEKYNVLINFDNKDLQCSFEPIRIETDGEKFISSGKFTDINSYDRISLVQYCFRKQIENSNK